jgi:Zn-dependent protease
MVTMHLSFRLFGIPVLVQPIFFLLICLGASGRIHHPLFFVEWLVAGTLSILVHEMGHAAAFRFFGFQPAIALHGMGGVTWNLSEKRITPTQDVLISLSGPFAGFLIGGVVLLLSRLDTPLLYSSFARVTLSDLVWINIGWGIINLLPILPLDGGHVLESSIKLKSQRAPVIARVLSLFFSAIAGVFAFLYSGGWVVFLAFWCFAINLRSLLDLKKIEAAKELVTGWKKYEAKDFDGALEAGRGVEHRSPSVNSKLLIAMSTLGKGDLNEAWTALKKLRPSEVPDEYLKMFEERLTLDGRLEDANQIKDVLVERSQKSSTKP